MLRDTVRESVFSDGGNLLLLVYFIYFFCGLTQCFESVFLPEIRTLYHLNYQQQMYTILAKNLPFLVAPAIGLFTARLGCKPCLAIAMLLYALGAACMAAAVGNGSYIFVLLSFFVIGTGFAVQMVAGNPLLRALGPVDLAASRMNLGNALGAIAQILAPALLTLLIPASAVLVSERLPRIRGLFATLAALLIAVTVLVYNSRDSRADLPISPRAKSAALELLAQPHDWLGFGTIFLVLGIEASLFVMYRNYVESPAIAGLSAHSSERLLTLYFALFAAGRLAGSWIQKRIRPELNVIAFAVPAALCLVGVVTMRGRVALAAVTTVGFFISIFFPTLYAVFLRDSHGNPALSSGMLTMGFLGCAVIPVLQGRLADSFGLSNSYLPGIAIYILVALIAARELSVHPAGEATV